MSQEAVAPAESGNRWVWVGAVLVLALGLRLLFLVGMTGSDDLHYAGYAHAMAQGDFHFDRYIHSFNLGIILPTALGYRLFGVSTATTVWFTMLMSLVGVLSAYLVGKELFGERAGLWAAALYALFPIDVVQAGVLGPDVCVATLSALALWCVLRGERARETSAAAGLFLAAGLLLGYAYLCKITGLLPVGVLVLYGLIRRRRLPMYALVVAGFGAFMLAEGILYSATMGDFFLKPRVVSSFDHALGDGLLAGQLASLTEYPRAMFVSAEEFGLFWYLVLAAAIWAIAARTRRAWVVALWVVPLLLYLEFGFSSLKQLTFPVHVPRYLTLVTIPATALAGAFFAAMGGRWKGALLPMVAGLTAVAAIFSTALCSTLQESRSYNPWRLARKLGELPPKPTYLLSGAGTVRHLMGYAPSDLRPLYRQRDKAGVGGDPEPVESLAGSYVVVDWGNIRFERERHDLVLPDYVVKPPADWTERARIANDFRGWRYLPVRLVRWALDRKLVPGPVGRKVRHTLDRVMRHNECIIYETPMAEHE